MENEVVIKASGISKVYKLYDNKKDRLKEIFTITKKKYYSEYFALKDIGFEIRRGEAIGIIGLNGAGKSTLLKILTGVTAPTTGVLEVHGKISALLELGAGFNPNYTGLENIYLNGTMMGFSETEMRIKIPEIIKFADIGEFVNQPVKNYSSGMFARLAFAVAISIEPDILIVDEALSVGDIFFQNKCFRKIKELMTKNTTILFVSHDLSSIKEMCEKTMWLDEGTIRIFGESQEVCNQYSNCLLEQKSTIYNTTNDIKDIKQLYEVNPLNIEKCPDINFSKESIISDVVNIISCFLQDKNGIIKNTFMAGESCRFSMIFSSQIPMEQCIAGFAITDVKGTWMVNPNTLISGEKKSFSVVEKSLNRVDFIFDIPRLLPGSYLLEAAVAEGVMENYKTHTWLYNVLNLEIENRAYQYALLDIDTQVKIFSSKLENMDLGRWKRKCGRTLTASLYYTLGMGEFCEADKVAEDYIVFYDGSFKIKFNIQQKGIKELRFDPCEQRCLLKNCRILINNREVSYKPMNASFCEEGRIMFDNMDPTILIDMPDEDLFEVVVDGAIDLS